MREKLLDDNYLPWVYKAQHGGGGVRFSLELGVHLHPGAGWTKTFLILSTGGAEFCRRLTGMIQQSTLIGLKTSYLDSGPQILRPPPM